MKVNKASRVRGQKGLAVGVEVYFPLAGQERLL